MLKIRKQQGTRMLKQFIGYLLVLSLIFANMKGLQVQAAETKEDRKVVYLNGETGSDKKDGTTPEQAVLTVTKAKELLAEKEEEKDAKSGVINITGKITIEKETTYYDVDFETELEDPVIIVKEDGQLTLNQVSFTGVSDILIENQGLVKLVNTNVFKKEIEILGDDGISSKDEGRVEKVVEKLPNDLSISCENVTYGNPLSPVLLTNTSKAEVVYSYKLKSLDDHDYIDGLPTEVGTYTIKATSKETDIYEESVAYADVTITEANPIEVIFPDAEVDQEETSLEDMALSQGQGEGSSLKSSEQEREEIEQKERVGQETKAQETKSQETEEVQEETEEIQIVHEIPEAVVKVEEEIVSLPETLSKEDISHLIDLYKKYDSLQDTEKAMITSTSNKKLEQAIEQAGKMNKTSNGVTVKADFLPWYVQLEAQLKEKSEHSQDAKVDEIILPYEIKLWDLLEDQEYHLPEGKKAVIYIPVNNLEEYENLVILHYLEDGTIEYITPNISGNTVIFETASFSPFDLSGSQVIVGVNPNKIMDQTNEDTSNTTNPSKENNKTDQTNVNKNKDDSKNKNQSSNNQNNNKVSKMVAPKTSDTTSILPFLILLVIAAVAIAVVVVMNRNKNKEINGSKEGSDPEVK